MGKDSDGHGNESMSIGNEKYKGKYEDYYKYMGHV